MDRYASAKALYKQVGVDAEAALAALKDIPISVHCWQGDDVIGFDGADSLSGGIQTTGNYPGRARTPEELLADIEKAFSLMPGKKRLNVHACYAFLGEDKGKVDRDRYTYKHFERWVTFAKSLGLDGVDFNPTFFAHPMVKDGLTLSSPDEPTRHFWVEPGQRSLEIAAEMGKAFGKPCLVNIWIPDGFKDVPSDRLGPRLRLKKSLDEILASYDKKYVIPAVESKVFGIGVESYTVGNNEFYQNYAATRGKIPSLLAFYDKVALHVTRPVRWDSDHVVLFEDELKEIAKEIVRNDATEKVLIGLDYFDASINRLSAWVTGQRSMQKALLYALLLPNEQLKKLQDDGDFTRLMVAQEEAKMLPFSDVWQEYLTREGLTENYYDEIALYEKSVLGKRK